MTASKDGPTYQCGCSVRAGCYCLFHRIADRQRASAWLSPWPESDADEDVLDRAQFGDDDSFHEPVEVCGDASMLTVFVGGEPVIWISLRHA